MFDKEGKKIEVVDGGRFHSYDSIDLWGGYHFPASLNLTSLTPVTYFVKIIGKRSNI